MQKRKDEAMSEDKTEVQAAAARAAATKRLRRKLEILKLDAAKSRGQLFHDLQECQALMDIIAKEEGDK